MKKRIVATIVAMVAAVSIMGCGITTTTTTTTNGETTTETEGQGDIIDDEFAVNEVDARIALFNDRPTGVTQYVRPTVAPVVTTEEANGAEEAEEVEGQGDVIDDEFAYVEGQGDVIDDEFAYVEGQGDVIDDEFAYVEGQGDVIDDEFAYVEGQGDVIDDEFAVDTEVEGQGDVIDDEFAVVEGQGDVIDDEFAVTPEEEAAVEAVEVAENDTEVVAPSVNSFVAVGSVDCADASKDDVDAIIEKKIKDCEIKRAYDLNKIPEENKSELTKVLEKFDNGLNLYKNEADRVCNEIDSSDKLGVAEKEYFKEMTNVWYGTVNGLVTKELIPGVGAVRKGAQALESFSKAKDAKGFTETTVQVLDGVKKSLQTAIAIIPGGGGLINSAIDAGASTLRYATMKVWSWFS